MTPILLALITAPAAPVSAPPPPVFRPLPVRSYPAAAQRAILIEGGSIDNSDYPVEAIRLNQQGSAGATFTVMPDGTVGGCRITTSSGSPSLDAVTCRTISTWRYRPARDRRGIAVPETRMQNIRWVMPHLGPWQDSFPIEGTQVLTVAPDGKVLACEATLRLGKQAPTSSACPSLPPDGSFGVNPSGKMRRVTLHNTVTIVELP